MKSQKEKAKERREYIKKRTDENLRLLENDPESLFTKDVRTWLKREVSQLLMYSLTQEERRTLQEERVTQEESNEIDRILDNMHGMLIVLS